MSELKTQKSEKSVEEFLNEIPGDQKRKDCFELLSLISDITQSKAAMWGPAIVGFGNYLHKYPDGRTLDWFLTGFSPRKQNLTLYVSGFKNYENLLQKLGKYKVSSGSCLYVKKLADIDKGVLKELIEMSVNDLNSNNDKIGK